MASSRARSQLVLTQAMRWIIDSSENPIMGTLTCAENIADKKEVQKRFRRVLERVRRHFKAKGLKVSLAGAWQRQDRGAWHPHFICSRPLDVVWLRALAVECGFGVQLRLDYIKPYRGFRHYGSNKAIGYIARYVTREFSDTADSKGVRLTFYFECERGTCRGWSFAGGLARLHRLGCRHFFGSEETFKSEDWYYERGEKLPAIMRPSEEGEGWLAPMEKWRYLVRLGWDSLHDLAKDAMFLKSRGVQWFLASEGLVDCPF